jgi:predicted DNA-binding transcriptional regulator AlpA
MNRDNQTLPMEGFARLNDFVGKGKLIPISRSSWYSLVRAGRAPKPTLIGPRMSVYEISAIRRFVASLAEANR